MDYSFLTRGQNYAKRMLNERIEELDTALSILHVAWRLAESGLETAWNHSNTEMIDEFEQVINELVDQTCDLAFEHKEAMEALGELLWSKVIL